MKPDERRRRIADLVKEASRASGEELAGLLDTSRETVRRDLALLSEQGVVRKVFPKGRVDGHAEQVLQALQEL